MYSRLEPYLKEMEASLKKLGHQFYQRPAIELAPALLGRITGCLDLVIQL